MKSARPALLGLLAAAALAGCAEEEPLVHFPLGDVQACERPEPRPAMSPGAPRVLSHEFRRESHSRAVEIARLAGGVYLQILHQACGKESQTFRFFLPKGKSPAADAASVNAKAAELMRALEAPGPAGAALHQLTQRLSDAGATPLGTRLEIGEFQELMVTTHPAPETSVYETIVVVTYRLKV